jgi:hypothetical protein
MKEHHPVFPRPSQAALESQGRACLEQFDPRRIIYLDGAGRWKENPRTLRDRISHGLLFELRTGTEEQALAWLREAFSPFTAEAVWPAVQKLAVPRLEKEVRAASADRFSFLVLLEILILTVKHEIFRLNAEAPAPDWDSEARAFKSEARKRLIVLEEEVGSTLAEAERSGFMEALSRLKRGSGSLIGRTAKLISQEEKINSALETLLREAADNSRHEEICGLIAEKIQPPMGIVTETPPSLFFPCLRLLLDQRIDVTSGIPYAASVLLGVFRDPRSAESLLRALELFPLRHTKIRENLIYTLGCLREGRAVDALIEVLDAPDEKRDAGPQGETVSFLLEQKEEAIWALGKIGFDSLRAVPALAGYADHPSARLKSYLAWTLGELGKAQKERSGGVSADVVIALLKLLKEKNRQVFEEAASALKKIDLPEFVHSLYLYHAGAISILGLKPAQRGLYELSETLHHLLQTKRRTVMAVNGDSGTGKTYFCQAITDGFAGIRADEILYLTPSGARKSSTASWASAGSKNTLTRLITRTIPSPKRKTTQTNTSTGFLKNILISG